jgi:hypothetical protein
MVESLHVKVAAAILRCLLPARTCPPCSGILLSSTVALLQCVRVLRCAF